MRILCISPLFPPVADSESFCAGKMVLGLMESGADVTVIHCSNFRSPTIRCLDQSELWLPLMRVARDIPLNTRRERARSLLAGLNYCAPVYARWIDDVVCRATRSHSRTPYDVVYSRSLPMIAHVCGYWCSRRLKVPWVANINDPWDYHLFPGQAKTSASLLYRSFSDHWLRKTLLSADVVTYPCDRLQSYHAEISGIEHDAEIVPHVGNCSEQASCRERFTLVHAGKLGTAEMTGRSATGLLKGIKGFIDQTNIQRECLQLVLVGPADDQTRRQVDDLGLGESVRWVERVSYEKSLEYIARASVCVLVEGRLSEGIFLPSKLIDYIVARKPVLALSPARGVVADMASTHGIIRVDGDDAVDVQKAITRLFYVFGQGNLAGEAASSERAVRFSPRTIAGQFLSATRGLISATR